MSVRVVSQVNAAANFMGTIKNIGALVSAASIPCGSLVSLVGQLSGPPMAFSCLPVPLNMQELGFAYYSGVTELCCPSSDLTIQATNAACSSSDSIDASTLLQAVNNQIQLASSTGISGATTTASKGPCDSEVGLKFCTQPQVRIGLDGGVARPEFTATLLNVKHIISTAATRF